MNVLNTYVIDYNLLASFEITVLKQNGFAPLIKDDFLISVACTENANLQCLHERYHLPIKCIEISEAQLMFLLKDLHLKQRIYNSALHALNSQSVDSSYMHDFMSLLLHFCIINDASDIHIESSELALTIRTRIDGILQHLFCFDCALYPIISSVVKLFSNLDITMVRLPQNGRFTQKINEKNYDFRVSIVPTIYGESLVIRILDKTAIHKKLDELGFQTDVLKQIKHTIGSSQGLVLVTGPTGSGKTTTLYSMIKELNTIDKKIITIEDPVEYKIDQVQQIAVNNEINLGFAQILKDVLRQDPDIIMIGEIRDSKSLQIAIQASLTGHLVFATLHANNSFLAINRLLDLDAERFLIASTLKAVISQRLVLCLCPHCKQQSDELPTIYKPSSCPNCNLTGFKGRTMLHEVLFVDQPLSSMIIQADVHEKMLEHAKKSGFRPLMDNGLQKINEGITTLAEVYKVL
jgi:general secretion pathway protein E